MKKIKILIADDHPIFREGLYSLLNSKDFIEICGVAENGVMAIELCKKNNPDIAIFDISMPEMNGIEASEILLKECPKIKVIFLTMHRNINFAKFLKKKNVYGFVLKENTFEDLIYAIKSIIKGGKFISPLITESFIESDSLPHTISLSAREKEILKWLKEGLSTKEIAEKLFISHKTVETHKSRIMKKFNVNRTTDLIKKIIYIKDL